MTHAEGPGTGGGLEEARGRYDSALEEMRTFLKRSTLGPAFQDIALVTSTEDKGILAKKIIDHPEHLEYMRMRDELSRLSEEAQIPFTKFHGDLFK